MRAVLLTLALVPLTACGVLAPDRAATPVAPDAAGAATVAPPPPRGARTADAYDTTTEAQRAAAAAPAAASAERRLGQVVASLGDPSLPGFWMETPLVSSPVEGRVELPASGASAKVELRPAGAGGNRLSLAAMRLLGADLAGLPEVVVWAP